MMESADLPGSPQHVVDSSGWLEYFADEENAEFFAKPIQQTDHLVVSTMNVYEVFKHVLRERGNDATAQAVAYLRQGTLVGVECGPLDPSSADQSRAKDSDGGQHHSRDGSRL